MITLFFGCFSGATHLIKQRELFSVVLETWDIVNLAFVLQDGYWELATELGELINVNVDLFANVFLKSKGICSLGENSQNLFQAFTVEICWIIIFKEFEHISRR